MTSQLPARRARRLQRTVNHLAGDQRSWAPAAKLRTPPRTITREQLEALQQRFQRPLIRDQEERENG
jgi:hypothetical protein